MGCYVSCLKTSRFEWGKFWGKDLHFSKKCHVFHRVMFHVLAVNGNYSPGIILEPSLLCWEGLRTTETCDGKKGQGDTCFQRQNPLKHPTMLSLLRVQFAHSKGNRITCMLQNCDAHKLLLPCVMHYQETGSSRNLRFQLVLVHIDYL